MIEDEGFDEDEKLEEEHEKQKELYEMDETPSPKEAEDLYTLFKWIIARGDSSKIGNLKKEELGMLSISVRDCQKIDLLADALKHPGFGKFFMDTGEVILATSLSREAHLINLFVTTQKKTTKAREIAVQNLPQPEKKKKGFFSR